MEINKVNFESFKTNDITKSFEDLDVNGDGKITNADLSATENSSIKSQIQSLLNSVDDDPVIAKAGAGNTTDENGITAVNDANFDDLVTNSTGTVYVVMGNPSRCGRCVSLDNEINGRLDELTAKAKVFSLNCDECDAKFWEVYKAVTGNSSGSVGLPVVVKFVDGKPVELVSEGSADYSAVVQNMIDMAESGTAEATATTEGTTTTATATTTEKTDADIQKAAEDLLAKYPPAQATGEYDIYSTGNPELMALKQAMEDGAIEDLSAQGFTRDNIIAIISKAYPNTGIKANDKGGYDCPYGHGDARVIYDMFVEKMSQVSSSDKTELMAQVAELNAEINANNLKLNNLKGAIVTIQNEIETLIEDAIKDSEEIQEDQKEASALIVKEELAKYTAGEGEVSYDDFQNNVSERLDTLAGSTNSKLSSVVLKLINAESKMGVLKGYMDSFKIVVDANKALASKVSETETAAASATDCEAEDVSSRCDPIGFTVNGVKYDFFVDKDNDGKLSNENEFLGAKDGWAEMTALDTDGDGKVSSAEMGDMMLVVTDADGNQSVKKATDILGEKSSIDLSSYEELNQDFDNGNTLLGTFSMDYNGQEVNDGYNTMDKLSWLDENYEFSDKEKGINRFAKGNTQTDDIVDYSEEYDTFLAKYNDFETKLNDTWGKVGITRVDVSENIYNAKKDASSQAAKEIEELLKKKTPAEGTDDGNSSDGDNGGNTEGA